MALLIAHHLFGELWRDAGIFQPFAQVFPPAREIVSNSGFKPGKFFEKDRQLRRGQQGQDDLFDHALLADGEHNVERIQRQH
ncbi:hypothetical protein D3C76_1283650 [compost metagenome]